MSEEIHQLLVVRARVVKKSLDEGTFSSSSSLRSPSSQRWLPVFIGRRRSQKDSADSLLSATIRAGRLLGASEKSGLCVRRRRRRNHHHCRGRCRRGHHDGQEERADFGGDFESKYFFALSHLDLGNRLSNLHLLESVCACGSRGKAVNHR